MPVWGSLPASGRLKVGLVGCGGRGTGAANQAINADPGVLLWAMGDVYGDRLKGSLDGLAQQHGNRVMVDESRQFVGFDAIDKVLDRGHTGMSLDAFLSIPAASAAGLSHRVE